MVLDVMKPANVPRFCRARAAASCTQTNELSMSLTEGVRIVFRIDSVMACVLLAVAMVVYSV